jgi:AcrR family transcriptional regulator
VTEARTRILSAAISELAGRGVRGLRVQRVADAAGVSVALVYHYFTSREGLLEAALESLSERAVSEWDARVAPGSTPREELITGLLAELQDEEGARSHATAWGELRWAAVFEPSLRPSARRVTRQWIDDVADLVARARATEGKEPLDAHAAAERLAALAEGLTGLWLTESVELARLRDLMRQAIVLELDAR